MEEVGVKNKEVRGSLKRGLERRRCQDSTPRLLIFRLLGVGMEMGQLEWLEPLPWPTRLDH